MFAQPTEQPRPDSTSLRIKSSTLTANRVAERTPPWRTPRVNEKRRDTQECHLIFTLLRSLLGHANVSYPMTKSPLVCKSLRSQCDKVLPRDELSPPRNDEEATATAIVNRSTKAMEVMATLHSTVRRRRTRTKRRQNRNSNTTWNAAHRTSASAMGWCDIIIIVTNVKAEN